MASVTESEGPTPVTKHQEQPHESAHTTSSTDATQSAPQTSKSIHSLVLDAGPLIRGDPSISTLLAQAEEIFTVPQVLDELKDEATRARIRLIPDLKLRSPGPKSVKFVSDFAKKTGDFEVLSKPDIYLLALTYELELERNHGDWRLRNTPGQQRLNGKPPGKEDGGEDKQSGTSDVPVAEADEDKQPESSNTPEGLLPIQAGLKGLNLDGAPAPEAEDKHPKEQADEQEISQVPSAEEEEEVIEGEDDDDSDGEWITPSNLKKHQEKDNTSSAAPQPIQRVLQAALLSSDFAVQNVALRINLNCCSSSLYQIKNVKTWVLRCHGCFTICRDTSKQFCPKCGQSTLTRVSSSVDSDGKFRVHLKKNYQWSHRGNRYSIPKPVHGSANGKLSAVDGGGHNGWGKELILTEDQKEYTRKVDQNRRMRHRDPMDEDYLPDMLSGERSGGQGGRIRVGAGRNINSKKRR